MPVTICTGEIDADSIERIEVIRGPQSVLYGSNALGGVLNFITKSCPYDYTLQGAKWGMFMKPTYGTAANEWRFRSEIMAVPRVLVLFSELQGAM